jgi:hypothetical protein
VIGQATAHRRANAFAQALEDAAVLEGYSGEHGAGGTEDESARGTHGGAPASRGGHGGHGGSHAAHAADRHADPEQAGMLALAEALGSRPRPVMSPEKKTVQRAQLIAAMEQAIADGSFAAGRVPEQRGESDRHGSHRATGLRKLAPRSRLSRRLAVGGLTMGVAAGAFGGVAAASTNALPGDTLYGLKRGMEDLKLDMASGDASRGKVYLDMASTRMQEARRLMDRGRGGHLDHESVTEVRKALSGMHLEAAEAHRLLTQAYQEDGNLQPMALLNSFAQSHRQGWTDLRGKLPSQLTDVSDQVNSVFDAIDQEVAPLQSLLPEPGEHHHSSSSTGHDDPTDSGGGTGTPTPTASAPATGPSSPATGAGAPAPSPSDTAPNGLIGGSDLLKPPTAGPTDPTSSPTATPTMPYHSVVLPPLLPGLLPGLGLSTDDGAE